MPTRATRRHTERRRKPRADARLSMRVEGVQEGAIAQIVTESQNISASGVYCTSPHYLAPTSKVALTIVLPNQGQGRGAKELVKCEGIVVRCEPPTRRGDKEYELACMFMDLDERRRGAIEDFVTWRNLQALRAAARAANGSGPVKKKAAKRRVVAPKARKKAAARR